MRKSRMKNSEEKTLTTDKMIEILCKRVEHIEITHAWERCKSGELIQAEEWLKAQLNEDMGYIKDMDDTVKKKIERQYHTCSGVR